MTMATRPDFVSSLAPPERVGPLLVATDGTLQSEAALRATALLAQRHGRSVHVVSVLPPVPATAADIGLVPVTDEGETVRREELRLRVADQVRTIAGDAARWPIDVVDGHAARIIVSAARELDASLIVMGLGRHRLIDRLVGAETVVQVLRLATAPVLAVPASFNELPRRAVAGIDFSELGTRAVRVGLPLLADGASAHLVHVNDGTDVLIDGSIDEQGMERDWQATLRDIDAPANVRLRTLTLSGHPARELLAFARAARADLIVVGTHGRGMLQRLMLGSVANSIVRGVADASVLVVPVERAGHVPDSRVLPGRTSEATDRERFAPLLHQFTARNAGRRCSLEVDDPEFGAQVHGFDYPFASAEYHPHLGRVELRLGDLALAGHHLMRSIAHVATIDVVRDAVGVDQAMRLGHGDGHTLLTFAR